MEKNKFYKGYALSVSPVLLVSPWYKPTIGGVAEVAERLHQLLESSGIETHLLVCDGVGSQKSLIADRSSKNVWHVHIPCYIYYKIDFKSIVATLVRGILTVREILKFVRQRKIDTIILLFPIDYIWPFILIKYLTTLKIIVSYHGNDLTRYKNNPFLLRLTQRKLLLSADVSIVCAKQLAVVAQEIAEPNKLDIYLIPNCVDADHFLPPKEYQSIKTGHVSFIHISNFNPKKRTQDIVQAFAMAPLSPATRLVMVGCGPDFEETRNLTKSLGVASRVEFVGAQEDVRPFLWKADVFVLASDDEGAPLVLLEAMAAGLAWISTPWGAAEQLPPGECGLVIPAGSPEILAAAMADLAGDSEKRTRMGRRGRERAESDFNVETYLQKHSQLIQMVQRGPRNEISASHFLCASRTSRKD